MWDVSGTLVITIVDVNDYPPVFGKPWTVEEPYLTTSIGEEVPIGTSVGVFSATDPDSNIQRYELVPPSGYFEINSTTGEQFRLLEVISVGYLGTLARRIQEIQSLYSARNCQFAVFSYQNLFTYGVS